MNELERAVKNYRTLETELERARGVLRLAVIFALRAGMTQAELVRATGYSREQLRRIARDAGIKP